MTIGGRRNGLLLGLFIGGILSITFGIGFVTGAVVDRKQVNAATGASDPDLQNFLSVYHLVSQRSYFRPFNKHRLIYAAIDGMLSATGDPHTLYLPPTQSANANTELNGSQFSGIGAIVAPQGPVLRIIAALPGSPAASAGLHSGDVVTAVDGVPVAKLGGDAAVTRIHGRSGSIVHLTVRRGAAPRVVAVHRAVIPAVTAYETTLPGQLGYLAVLSFGARTGDEVRAALQTLARQHVRGVVLDLRGNPGGYVDAAQAVASDFLSSGVVAYEKQTHGQTTALPVLHGQRVIDVPVAVLVDGGTASAAEITAAALRDDGHAVLIGTRTYGKGSMQSVYNLADGSSVRITDRLWLTPSKQSIGGKGLRPNLPVAASNGEGPYTNDAQLLAAERYLIAHSTR